MHDLFYGVCISFGLASELQQRFNDQIIPKWFTRKVSDATFCSFSEENARLLSDNGELRDNDDGDSIQGDRFTL